tara:strand:+ start:443 stop:838 length:396 start_codon:yes stop_codon:yes gene_type:complete
MVTQSAIQTPPPSWEGSVPEWVFYASLTELGYIDGEDFIYQNARMGGRLDKGGAIIDFLFYNPPNLAVNVQGVYYHYELGAETKARDIMIRESLAGQGITLIFVDEDDLLQDPVGITRAALNYQDRSRLGG